MITGLSLALFVRVYVFLFECWCFVALHLQFNYSANFHRKIIISNVAFGLLNSSYAIATSNLFELDLLLYIRSP